MIYAGFTLWLRATGRTSLQYNVPFESIEEQSHELGSFFVHINGHITILLLYLGLFLFPVLTITSLSSSTIKARFRWLPIVISSILLFTSVLRMVHLNRIIPIGQNVLLPEGIGPLTLRDTYILNLPDVPKLPTGFWIGVTIVSLLGQFLLVKRVFDYLLDVFGRRNGFAIERRCPAR